MWELIQANKRKSIMLMVLMALMLSGLGYTIGLAFGPQGGWIGLLVAVGIWIILTLVSLGSGDQILLAASRARPVTHDVHPVLFNVVEEMTIAANLPKIPKIYIINDPAPNAFATGRSPQTASVAVTAGLLGKLDRDELQGVIAHEISHIVHRDILFVTMAGIMLGTVVLLSQVFLRSMFYGSMMGSRRRYSSGGQGSGQAQLIMFVIALIAAIVAPIMATLLYYALSRRREYLADAGAARLTRYPEGLARALEKIANDASPSLTTANKVTAPMYIANPLKRRNAKKLSDLSSTHPPISERVRILRSMTHGASYVDYSKAFTQVTDHGHVLPASAKTDSPVALRETPTPPRKKSSPTEQLRQVGDTMRLVNGFIFLTCACGLKLKIPPNFKGHDVKCPRCRRRLHIKGKAGR
jgi:heat shock protein HtpX